ncbi:MAG TPA: hypothetical protein VFW16_12590 [Streptosporangiaceae bacterium]|nr:hypothetical protein [Streptosporangiaceae bacterium]
MAWVRRKAGRPLASAPESSCVGAALSVGPGADASGSPAAVSPASPDPSVWSLAWSDGDRGLVGAAAAG